MRPEDGRARRGPRAVLAAALLVLCAVVLGVHALAGARTTRGWFSGEQGGLADLAWRQAECLGRALVEVVPAGATVHVPAELGLLAQRLGEHAFRRGTVVASAAEADVTLTITSTAGQGCDGMTLGTAPPSTVAS
ncbi:MAG: hypothetical protein GEV08_11595 [Acidimicrobiia bacterium]|nr:hypothetical protein [Acidimicrobiia bacterium]